MNKRKYGFGIIGTGSISEVHAKAIAAIEEAHLLGVCSRRLETAQQFAARHSCIAYASAEEMLRNPEIEVVCICTPSGYHMEPALQCLEAGKHCLIEKPLEVSLEKCNAIIAKADAVNKKVGVVFPSRFYDAAIRMKEAVNAGKLGTNVLGDAYVKWHRSDAYYQSADWRGTWNLDGGGALMNQGIHSIDLLQWYMGPVASVHAFAANRKHQQIEVEDTIVAVLKFESGALGNVACSTALFPGELKRIELMGTEGTMIMEESMLRKWEFAQMTEADLLLKNDLASQTLSHGGGAANPMDISFLGHQRQIEDLLKAIANNSTPLVDAREGRKSVEIVRAIYESARIGQTVHLQSVNNA